MKTALHNVSCIEYDMRNMRKKDFLLVIFSLKFHNSNEKSVSILSHVYALVPAGTNTNLSAIIYHCILSFFF